MVKKILIYLLVALSILSAFVVFWYYNEGKLGKGDYFLYYAHPDAIKSFTNDDIYISDILEIKYDDNYIIAIRIPAIIFYGESDCHSFFESTLHYLLINKQTNKIYETDNLKRFRQKLANMDISLDFDANEIQRAYQTYEQNKHLYKNQKSLAFLKQHCKEDFVYPIEKF